jgi:hypothetical protein
MRDLARSERNAIAINDAVSGSTLELYYRTPKTSEMAAYQAKFIKRQGKKVLINSFETRLEFGLKIITGFREGDFGVDGKPISSDPSSPNYREDWKRLLKENAADVVTVLAFTVFEGARANDVEVEDLAFAGMEEEAEEEAPLSKSSGGSSTDAPRSEEGSA